MRERSGGRACMDGVYAGMGNTALMSVWQSAFREAGCDAGSMLVTDRELDDIEGEQFARTLREYAVTDVVAVINANDALSNIGALELKAARDNDGLAGHIARLGADELTIFTQQGGIVDKRGSLVEKIDRSNAGNVREMLEARTRNDSRKHNGIVSKFDAAWRTAKAGVACVRVAAVNGDMSGEKVTEFVNK